MSKDITYTTTTDEQLRDLLLKSHGADTTGTSYTVSVAQSNLLNLIASMPVFSPQMLYEVLGYQTPDNRVRTYLSRLVKKDCIKSLPMNHTMDSVKSLYYATKRGFQTSAGQLPVNREFHSKTGKRIMETGMHDYGTGYSYLAYLTSPFTLYAEYETHTTFPEDVMPKGKKALRSIRHDAVYHLTDQKGEELTAYIEHDTGSEGISVLAKKLPQYSSHGLMEGHRCNDLLIFTFRTSNPAKPPCFVKACLHKMAAAMTETETIPSFSARAGGEYRDVLNSLEKYTTAFRRNWKRSQIESLCDRLTDGTDLFYRAFLAIHQDTFARDRRNLLLRAIDREYSKPSDTDYTHAFLCMTGGFRVVTASVLSLPRVLPYIHPEAYPDSRERIRGILSTVYPDVSYLCEKKTYEKTLKGEAPVTLRNIFHSKKGHTDISVEYLSHDISAFLKAKALLGKCYDPHAMPLVYVMLVDHTADARYFSDLFGYRYDISEIFPDRIFLCFLNVDGTYLYMIGPDGEEIRIRGVA